MKKIGILVTHPIQYYSPFFKELAKESDLIVYYCLKLDKKRQGREFDIEFDWDIPLLEGYKYEFLNNISKNPNVNTYSGCDTPEIANKIKASNFELFIVFGWYYKGAHQALSACKKYKTPIYARGDSTLLSGNFIIRMAKQIYFKNFLDKFDGFLSVGKMFEEYLKFYGVPKEKIIFCPHFVDSNFFNANTAQSLSERINLRKSYNINKDEPILLFCGKLVERKRPFDFLKALKILKSGKIKAKGLIIGDGELKERLRKYAIKNKLDVLFLGFLNQTQLPAIYSIADCLVLPSDGRETWGLVVNEAFACGLPAIVSDEVGCMPDLIDKGKTGYVYKCGNISELALKIEQFIKAKKIGFDFTMFIRGKIAIYSIEKAIESIKILNKNARS